MDSKKVILRESTKVAISELKSVTFLTKNKGDFERIKSSVTEDKINERWASSDIIRESNSFNRG